MSVKFTQDNVDLELSSEELDIVTGGTGDFVIDFTRFQEKALSISQSSSSGPNGSSTSSTIESLNIDTSAFHEVFLGS